MLCKIISRAALNPFAGHMHYIKKNFLAGRIQSLRGPHAARGLYVWHPWLRQCQPQSTIIYIEEHWSLVHAGVANRNNRSLCTFFTYAFRWWRCRSTVCKPLSSWWRLRAMQKLSQCRKSWIKLCAGKGSSRTLTLGRPNRRDLPSSWNALALPVSTLTRSPNVQCTYKSADITTEINISPRGWVLLQRQKYHQGLSWQSLLPLHKGQLSGSISLNCRSQEKPQGNWCMDCIHSTVNSLCILYTIWL